MNYICYRCRMDDVGDVVHCRLHGSALELLEILNEILKSGAIADKDQLSRKAQEIFSKITSR